ncbi:GGDEF domain-containing protein [Aurantimonas aggregata]|nr:GGDEF domain-containing protein [Aurantimonas aggregata]
MPELIGIMYTSQKSVALVGAALVATCLAIYIKDGDPVVAVTAALSIIIVAGRVLNSAAYHRAAAEVTTARIARIWEIRYAIGGAAFAAVVGLFAAYVIWSGTPTSQLLAATVMLAYPTGMIARVAVRPAIARLHLALALSPPIVAALSLGTPEHWMLALLFTTYLLAGVEIIRHLASTIADRVHLHQEVTRRATHDDLTGLPNRAHFRARLAEAHRRLERYGTRFAVHAFDLDHFKTVNDTHGHAAGDRVLQQVAERVLATVRSTDVVARLGGDEFAILQFPIGECQEAEILGRRVAAAVSQPLLDKGQRVLVGASVGVTICNHSAGTIDEIMHQADTALYAAKAAGRGRSEVYPQS